MKSKILVTYTSKYGSTRKYAEWISQELQADLVAAGTIGSNTLSQYDVVIYGGGLYAGGIAGVRLVTQNTCQNLIVFTVGLADPGSTDYRAIINKSFPPKLLEGMKIFHLRGGIDYQKLSPVHKVLMAMMKRRTEKKPESELNAEDQEFLATYNAKVSFEDKQTIEPIITYVKGLKPET